MIVIGVDGGGTKTEAVAVDECGNVLGSGIGGSSNVIESGEKETRKSLEEALSFVRDLKDTDLKIGMGMPAVGEIRGVEDLYSKMVFEILGVRPASVVNDVVIGWYAGTKGEDGIHVVAGTGSIAYAKNRGRDARCGGWGSLIGDEGSAYDIGVQTLRAVSMQLDGRMKETLLKSLIFERLSLEDEYDFSAWVYNLGKNRRKKIASVARIAYEAAKRGDEVSIEILKRAGEELGRLVGTLSKKLDFEKTLISYSGSVLEKNEFVRKSFEKFVMSKIRNVELKSPRCSPAFGGIIMTFEKSGLSVPDVILNMC